MLYGPEFDIRIHVISAQEFMHDFIYKILGHKITFKFYDFTTFFMVMNSYMNSYLNSWVMNMS